MAIGSWLMGTVFPFLRRLFRSFPEIAKGRSLRFESTPCIIPGIASITTLLGQLPPASKVMSKETTPFLWGPSIEPTLGTVNAVLDAFHSSSASSKLRKGSNHPVGRNKNRNGTFHRVRLQGIFEVPDETTKAAEPACCQVAVPWWRISQVPVRGGYHQSHGVHDTSLQSSMGSKKLANGS